MKINIEEKKKSINKNKDFDENRYLKFSFNVSQRDNDFRDLYDFESNNILKSELCLSESANLFLNKSKEVEKIISLDSLKDDSSSMFSRVDYIGKIIFNKR